MSEERERERVRDKTIAHEQFGILDSLDQSNNQHANKNKTKICTRSEQDSNLQPRVLPTIAALCCYSTPDAVWLHRSDIDFEFRYEQVCPELVRTRPSSCKFRKSANFFTM